MGTADNFANGTSSVYLDQMYEEWQRDPMSVHASWRAYFGNVDSGAEAPYAAAPRMGGQSSAALADLDAIVAALHQRGYGAGTGATAADARKAQADAFKVMQLIRAFMSHGHLDADVDPLELDKAYADAGVGRKFAPGARLKELINPAFYGFTEADLDRVFHVDVNQMVGVLGRQKDWKLRDLVDALRNAYCGKIGVEFMHIPHKDQCNWTRD